MKKLYSLSALLFLGIATHAQVFWTESFGTGCNRGATATAYTGSNGSWTVASTGTNGNVANNWFVSSTCSNTGAGNCADNCSFNAANVNATLHVSNISIVIPSFMTVGADTGSSYFSGGLSSFGYVGSTARRAESPVINCVGKSNMTVTFIYLENGDASNDDASFVYSADGGTTWSTVDPLAKTTGSCATGTGQWTSISVALPASANNNAMVKIGFNWVNNDDGVGTDPSFAVDDISITQAPTGIVSYNLSDVNVFTDGNGLIKINSNGLPYKTIGVYNLLGEETKFTTFDNSIQIANANAGIYIVALEVNGVRVTRKVLMN